MYSTVITPRVSETDGIGHINNCVMPVWFEAARTPIFEIFNPQFDLPNWHMFVVSTHLNYHRQTYYGRDVEVRGWVNRLGRSSFTLSEELYQDGECCVSNEVVYVNFDHETQRSAPLTSAQRAALTAHLKEEQKA